MIEPDALRRTMTDAKRALWFELRGRRLGGWKFKSQWSIGPFVVDFCCIERGLIVEADGGQHSPDADSLRTAFLMNEGYRLVRFWNHDVLGNLEGVLRVILDELGGERSGPHPDAVAPSARSGLKAAGAGKTAAQIADSGDRHQAAPSPARGSGLE